MRFKGRYEVWHQGGEELCQTAVLILRAAGISHPFVDFTFRSPAEIAARVETALKDRPYLIGERYTAVDLLLHSHFAWYPAATPDSDVVKAWIERCGERPSLRWTADYDAPTVVAALSLALAAPTGRPLSRMIDRGADVVRSDGLL